MLVEIHMIQNHAPSNLNRDDTGSPKEALFGGAMRARISSQCIKRSIRRSEVFRSEMADHLATRTRRLPEMVRKGLIESGLGEEAAETIAVKVTGFGSGKEGDQHETRQLVFLAPAEEAALVDQLRALWDDLGEKGFAKLTTKDLVDRLDRSLPRSVDIALFGRMTTDPVPFDDVQAAMQVAHAISTSKVDHQYDYFTAVDDLVEEAEDVGAGFISDVEFNSATYYKYFSLNWEHFVGNLGGDAEAATTARQALAAFIRAAALTTPTGKQNSFAANNLPDVILVEVKAENVPVSYANAFVKPIQAMARTDLVEESIKALWEYAAKIKSAYGITPALSVWLDVRGVLPEGAETVANLNELVAAVVEALPEVESR
jgi:CRISPR system Cascade subunit CasC